MTTALLVLDMLTDFTAGKLANPAAGQITEPIAALTRAARGRDGCVVIYGNDARRPGDFELAVFGEHAMAGTPGAHVIEALTPQEADITVSKRYYSAFTQTDLDATCRVRRIDRLVVTGQHTDCCRHTSYDAFARSIEVVVVADATAVYQPFTNGRYQHSPRTARCATCAPTTARGSPTPPPWHSRAPLLLPPGPGVNADNAFKARRSRRGWIGDHHIARGHCTGISLFARAFDDSDPVRPER